MADKRDQWADSFSAEPQSGWLTGFLADEDKGTRRLMWRLGSWGVAAVSAVSLAVLANQYELQLRRDNLATGEALGRQEQQLQQLTKEAQVENRRLSQAIDTLNSDRDRLFARVTSVEKGLESSTGSILARQTLPPAPREPAPQIAAPAIQPALSPSILTEQKAISPQPDLPSMPTKSLDGAASDTTAKMASGPAGPTSDVAPASQAATADATEPQRLRRH